MRSELLVSGALALAAAAGGSLEAQLPEHLREYPLTPLHESGDIVAPFFDGWFDNGDGTVTYAFGFLNRNTKEIVDIPLGENNRIEPAEYDGIQPTHFPVYNRRGLTGRSSDLANVAPAPPPSTRPGDVPGRT